jgi:hypothetical protein
MTLTASWKKALSESADGIRVLEINKPMFAMLIRLLLMSG